MEQTLLAKKAELLIFLDVLEFDFFVGRLIIGLIRFPLVLVQGFNAQQAGFLFLLLFPIPLSLLNLSPPLLILLQLLSPLPQPLLLPLHSDSILYLSDLHKPLLLLLLP